MLSAYHTQLTLQALAGRFSPRALQAIVAANLDQDRLSGLIGRPEFHFDDNQFTRGQAYLEAQRGMILTTLRDTPFAGPQPGPAPHPCLPAWQAFGRLAHAVQDFYAHSNYVALWYAREMDRRGRRNGGKAAMQQSPRPEEIPPLDPTILNSPALCSGRIYLPWEALVYIPWIGRLVKRLLPRNAHAWMNLDSPRQGRLFPFALAAARKRTAIEYRRIQVRILTDLGPRAWSAFTDRPAP